MSLPEARLGPDLRVPAIGLGCAGIAGAYGQPDEADALATLAAAADAGMALLDTADHYGAGYSELLIGRALRSLRREDVVLSVKFGALFGPDGGFLGVDGRPIAAKHALTHSLRRLGTDHVDVFRPSRLDPAVPIEETVGAIAELVAAGYVRGIGLSEVGEETIRRAHAVHPITDVQVEYSLFSRGVERSILPTCRELGIGVTAYGVLAQGLLTGSWGPSTTAHNRGHLPRFEDGNLAANLALVDRLRTVATDHGASVAQIAIACVLARARPHADVVAVVGASRPSRIGDLVGAAAVELEDAAMEAIERAVPAGAVEGERYAPALLKLLDSEG